MTEMNHEKIINEVKGCLAQVLEIEGAEINIDDSLINDLGVDSLDFLDLIFRLESTFNIKLRRGEIEGMAREITGTDGFEQDGVITSAGLTALQQALPEVPQDRFREGVRVAEIPTLFTVGTFVRLVESKLGGNVNEPQG